MFHAKAWEALVVGAGPVGLCAAVSLAEAGVRPTIIDSTWGVLQRPGAVLLHPQTLRLLGKLGVTSGLLGMGAIVHRISFHDETGARHGLLDLSRLEEPYPFVLALPQQRLIDALVEALAARDVPVTWRHRLTSLEQSQGELLAHVDELDRVSVGYAVAGSEEVVGRSFVRKVERVIGTDGAESVVRRFLQGRPDRVGAEGVQVVFEVTSSWAASDEARIIAGAHGASTLVPLPHGALQWSFFIDGGTYSEEQLTLEGLHAFLRQRAPWFTAPIERVDWAAVVPYAGGVATPRRHRAVWLAGDAAHTAVPIVSHPLNIGLAEAHEIAARLVAARRETSTADPALVAESFVLDMRAFLVPSERFVTYGPVNAWLRDHIDIVSQSVPARKGEFDVLGAQIGVRDAGQARA